jgi:hypothetical protein
MTKVGFAVMKISATVVAVEEPTMTKSKKGAADPEFKKEHSHCFF